MAASLTGKKGYRIKKRMWGKPLLVLQVEERHKGHSSDPYDFGKDSDYTRWRDATIEDLTRDGRIDL